MANCNAIKIRSTKKNKNGKPTNPKPSGANLAHNSAVNKANYWLNDGADIIQSQSYSNTHEVNADWNKWVDEARVRYANNPKNQRAIKSNAVLLEEGMIIVGTDVKVSDKDIPKIVKDFVAKFEKDNNTTVRHWAYHNHEGHTENGKEHINRHIHFIFDNVDNDGVMVRRNWKRDYFKQMQTDIFEVSKKYVKNIERAKESEYEEVQIEDRIVKINTRKHIHHRLFRKMKENEQIEDLSSKVEELKKENSSLKGQNTKNKNEKEKLKEANKALEMQLKELNTQLQSQLSNREQHAMREALVRDLKEELKAKTLTAEKMQTKFAELEEKLLNKEEKIEELEDEISKNDFFAKELEDENKALQEQNEVLEEKVSSLEEKINSRAIMSDYEDIKEDLEIVNESIGIFEEHYELQKTGNLTKLMQWVENKFSEFRKLLKQKDQEIAELKELVGELTPKQQKKESLNIVSNLMSEAKREILDTKESDSSNFNEGKKEVQEEEVKGKIRRDR